MVNSITDLRFASTIDYQVETRDVVYREVDARKLRGTVYQPQGAGPFPLLIDVHGGGWANYERLRDAPIDLELASQGIVVVAIDFRLNGEAPHPAAMEDINYAIRWFKAHASDFNADAAHTGGIGYSSGGHQVLMAGLRPSFGAYSRARFENEGDVDAGLSYVISCGCIFDVVTSMVSVSRGDADRYGVYTYFGGVEGVRDESPVHVIESDEIVHKPPLLVLQAGDDDLPGGQVPDATRFAEAYALAGGVVELAIFPGAPHIFLNSGIAPRSEAMLRGLSLIKGFIARQLEYQSAPFEQ